MFLGKTLNFHSASLHLQRRRINGYWTELFGKPYEILQGVGLK